ncbi:MAG: Trm112 family protein [Thermoprotei archaeon]|nr:MAG: Trm112 family protein [Thermoprotei archaeon]RLE99267.1 MAG: Trm112 family protein [Thermoprotei archaeon]
MKFRLLDMIVCPMCKHFPLRLYKIDVMQYPERVIEREPPLCELYCGYLGKSLKEIEKPPCEECVKYEVKEGVLYCENCGRWYPIIDEITILLPDDLRNKREDINFLLKHRDKLPENILYKSKPYALNRD